MSKFEYRNFIFENDKIFKESYEVNYHTRNYDDYELKEIKEKELLDSDAYYIIGDLDDRYMKYKLEEQMKRWRDELLKN